MNCDIIISVEGILPKMIKGDYIMSKYAAFNTERTFGVEIEFLNTVERSLVARKLREAGIEAYDETYNHETKNHWKIVKDASCGNEAVSPILKGYEGLEIVKKVCQVMNSLECKVDVKCGLHVHHGASDLTIKNFRNLYISYAKYEKLIDELLPMSRRQGNNGYCSSMIMSSYEQTAQRINACTTLQDIQQMYYSRYYKLNVQSYVKYGTVEFRQHSGTTEGEKIVNWIMFTQLMVERSKHFIIAKEEREYDNIGCLFNMLGIVRKATCSEEMFKMGNFYRARAKELKKEERMTA